MDLIRRVQPNRTGRDFVVGDIHGHFSALEGVLAGVGFDPECDRLFSVGDLIDRGPESQASLDWLARPWFFAVRGNHEDYAIRYVRTGRVDADTFRLNGGGWFLDMPPEQQIMYAAAFEQMPIALEVPVAHGLIGIVHADCPVGAWTELETALVDRAVRNECLWARRRVSEGIDKRVQGIDAVVVGHTTVPDPVRLGNVYHIDTGGWKAGGRFTLVELQSLVESPSAP